MKYMKLYERFEDFEEVWEEEPNEPFKLDEFNFIVFNSPFDEHIYLIQKFLEDGNVLLFKDFVYMPEKEFPFNRVEGKLLNDIIENKKSFYIHMKSFYKGYFRDLDEDIQKLILNSYGL